jgi:hypothetical protein
VTALEQVFAVSYLGSERLAAYRVKLHVWADSYRFRAWPGDTPEYLLRGYFTLLQRNEDLARMVTLAVDRARLDRMLQVTGGDAAGLEEIALVQDIIVAKNEPDLKTMLVLAMNRDRLVKRNSNIPAGLPAAWAALGNPARAQALAYSITAPDRHAQAMIRLAQAWAATGDLDRAENAAHSIGDPYRRSQALTSLVQPLAQMGERKRARRIAQQAEDTARSIPVVDEQAQASPMLVEALAATGEFTKAEETARSIADPDRQAWALTGLVDALAAAGEFTKAEETARSIADPDRQALALTDLVRALALAGDFDKAEETAGSIATPVQQAKALVSIADLADRPISRRHLARALSVGPVEIALPAVARIEPVVSIIEADSRT